MVQYKTHSQVHEASLEGLWKALARHNDVLWPSTWGEQSKPCGTDPDAIRGSQAGSQAEYDSPGSNPQGRHRSASFRKGHAITTLANLPVVVQCH